MTKPTDPSKEIKELLFLEESTFSEDEFGKYWKLPNGKYHRKYGPAIEYNSGVSYWYFNGLKHRLDGPAVVYPNGQVDYWIEGKPYSETQFAGILLILTKTLQENN